MGVLRSFSRPGAALGARGERAGGGPAGPNPDWRGPTPRPLRAGHRQRPAGAATGAAAQHGHRAARAGDRGDRVAHGGARAGHARARHARQRPRLPPGALGALRPAPCVLRLAPGLPTCVGAASRPWLCLMHSQCAPLSKACAVSQELNNVAQAALCTCSCLMLKSAPSCKHTPAGTFCTGHNCLHKDAGSAYAEDLLPERAPHSAHPVCARSAAGAGAVRLNPDPTLTLPAGARCCRCRWRMPSWQTSCARSAASSCGWSCRRCALAPRAAPPRPERSDVWMHCSHNTHKGQGGAALLFRVAGPHFGVWLAPCSCDSRAVLAHCKHAAALRLCLRSVKCDACLQPSAACHPLHGGSSEPKRRPRARQAYQLTLAGFEALGGATQLTSLSIDHLQACLALTCPKPKHSPTLALRSTLSTYSQQASNTCGPASPHAAQHCPQASCRLGRQAKPALSTAPSGVQRQVLVTSMPAADRGAALHAAPHHACRRRRPARPRRSATVEGSLTGEAGARRTLFEAAPHACRRRTTAPPRRAAAAGAF
jgi:hypothetical protein